MTKSLLSVLIVGLLAGAAGTCLAADANSSPTAYTALRTMSKLLGDETLNRVVEVTGRGGVPQPTTWRIVILEKARGTREIKVAGGRVIAQKATGESTSLKPIKLPDLNLDSSGAFDAANEQARKSRVPFTSLNYLLRVSEETGKPVWDLELYNGTGARVGGVRLAAHDGKMLSVNGFTLAATATPPPTLVTNGDHDSVQPTRVTPGRNARTTTTTTTYNTVRTDPPPPPPSTEGGFFVRAGRTLDHTTDAVTDTFSRTGQKVDRSVRSAGGKLQRFFTGNHDSDRVDSEPN